MSNQIMKCTHPNSYTTPSILFPTHIYENFFCPDCGKGWTIQIGNGENLTYVSDAFNIYWIRGSEPKPKISKINKKDIILDRKVCICHFVGEGSESCPAFKGPIWCLDEIKWRACKS